MLAWFFLSSGLALTAPNWPEIAADHQSFVVADGQHPVVVYELKSPERKALYRLECHNYLFDNDEFDYASDFECRLVPLYEVSDYSSLFIENPVRPKDWESRAGFDVSEVVGSCAAFADYGRVRRFRLRGMTITLSLSDVELEPSTVPLRADPRQFRSFTLTVDVRPDPMASSALAEPSTAPWPPDDPCGKGYRTWPWLLHKRGSVQRMPQ